MTSGGHARSGPAPDPYALRRGDKAAAGWVKLTNPTHPPPPWPLSVPPTESEFAIWSDLWARPQATAWPAYNLTREVAAYTRALAVFEEKPHAALGTLLRRMSDDMGLSVAGAARNRWLLPGAEALIAPAPKVPAPPQRTSSRDRFPRASTREHLQAVPLTPRTQDGDDDDA